MKNNNKKIGENMKNFFRRFVFCIDIRFWNIFPHFAFNFHSKEVEFEWICFGLYISFEKHFKKEKNVEKDYSFEEVDIFIRVKGRTPSEPEDMLTQKILDEFCERYKSHKLKSGMVSSEILYNLIKEGKIKSYV